MCETCERQAGILPADEGGERFNRFLDKLADIKQRWDYRMPVKGRSWAKAYINGSVWLTLNGKWVGRSHSYKWFCRVVAETYALEGHPSAISANPIDSGDSDRWHDKVMLVVNVDGPEGPQMIPSTVDGPYLVEDKFFGAGEGCLHKGQVPGLFEIVPYFRDGEIALCAGVDGSDDARRKVVKCCAKIVDGISDDECKGFWNWFDGVISKLKLGGLGVGWDGARADAEIVELCGQLLGHPQNVVNVLIGPVGFEPRSAKDGRGHYVVRQV